MYIKRRHEFTGGKPQCVECIAKHPPITLSVSAPFGGRMAPTLEPSTGPKRTEHPISEPITGPVRAQNIDLPSGNGSVPFQSCGSRSGHQKCPIPGGFVQDPIFI